MIMAFWQLESDRNGRQLYDWRSVGSADGVICIQSINISPTAFDLQPD